MSIREFETFAMIATAIAIAGQVRSWLAWVVGLLIVHRQVDAYSSGPVLGYLCATAKWRPRNGNYYSSERPPVRPLARTYRVWYEAMKEGVQTFWLEGRPVWYRPTDMGPPGNPRETTRGKFSYIRGTVDWDRVLAAVSAWEDAAIQDRSDGEKSRFEVVIHGQAMALTAKSGDFAAAPQPPPRDGDVRTSGITNPAYAQRILHWKASDLMTRQPAGLASLSLCAELSAAAARVRRWVESREWFEERGLPWRIGVCLSGLPGTGKTSFVRSLAVEHNLPIHVFDLAALDDYSLRRAWDQMVSCAPCVALIEDIDTVYKGRETLESVRMAPNFGSLLNCISGVQASDGVLLVVTTNRPELLDEALLRRGRLDIQVAVGGLDRAGRFKIAQRVLRDDAAAELAACDPGLSCLTPADFTYQMCCRALDAWFEAL